MWVPLALQMKKRNSVSSYNFKPCFCANLCSSTNCENMVWFFTLHKKRKHDSNELTHYNSEIMNLCHNTPSILTKTLCKIANCNCFKISSTICIKQLWNEYSTPPNHALFQKSILKPYTIPRKAFFCGSFTQVRMILHQYTILVSMLSRLLSTSTTAWAGLTTLVYDTLSWHHIWSAIAYYIGNKIGKGV